MFQKITLIFLFVTTILLGQSNTEIANIYFKKAEESMEKIDYLGAKKNFDKGVSYLDSVTSVKVAQQGAFIYYELKEYETAKSYASTFFSISRNKSSEDYEQMLELFVDMEERISKKKEEEEQQAKLKLAKERELKKIDSLKKVWSQEKEKFTLKFDSFSDFDKQGVAVFEKGKYYGLINDFGTILLEADKYRKVIQNEGYFVFLDDERSPQEIYSYNSKTERSIEIVDPSRYDEELSDYGLVTMPRGNGKIVMYPEDYAKTLVYDLEEEKFIKISDVKEFLKELKKDNKIDKYDAKERTVKIDKEWFILGNHLGGKVYSLYSVDNQSLKSYLFCAVDGKTPKVVKKSSLGYLGAYYSNKFDVNTKKGTIWVTNEGEEGSRPMFNNKYKGGTSVVKVEGGYQLVKDEATFLENKKIEKLEEFLKKNK